MIDDGRRTMTLAIAHSRELIALLAPRIFARAMPEPNTGCFLYVSPLTSSGYGKIGYQRRYYQAHRIALESMVGPLPIDVVVDHKCRVPSCVNPAHLEPVSPRENVMRGLSLVAANARKTHCNGGHPLDGRNLYILPNGHRSCRTCRNAASIKYQHSRGHSDVQ